MPRKPREDVADGVHHVYSRGNAHQLIYIDDFDRGSYLRLLGHVVVTKRWRCLAYCLMDNHVHLLVETPDPNLGSGMQLLHGLYAQTFNKRHKRVGHLFQGRFGSVRMLDQPQLWNAVGYIARNPVDAGACNHPADWRWSSHAATLARHHARPSWLDVPRLLEHFDSVGGEPCERYDELVARG
jgi:putative transposase